MQKELIGTQFETNFARQAFPCVDEPEAKATFDLAIKFDEHEGETILSNMPEKEVIDGVHHFETTVRMSTYLVAFAFGELQGVQTKTESGVQVGVFATKAHQANELDLHWTLLNGQSNSLKTLPNTLSITPFIAVGIADFSAGAMEKLGLSHLSGSLFITRS